MTFFLGAPLRSLWFQFLKPYSFLLREYLVAAQGSESSMSLWYELFRLVIVAAKAKVSFFSLQSYLELFGADADKDDRHSDQNQRLLPDKFKPGSL